MSDYPHVKAAFINVIAEEGTKEEAVEYLQKYWNKTCALLAEIERLNKLIKKAEAERDEARAQVAMAYEAAAGLCDGTAKYHMSDQDDIEVVRLTSKEIRALTYADAKSALEAYGRKKMREGMQRAASIGYQVCAETHHVTLGDKVSSAILAEMEKIK